MKNCQEIEHFRRTAFRAVRKRQKLRKEMRKYEENIFYRQKKGESNKLLTQNVNFVPFESGACYRKNKIKIRKQNAQKSVAELRDRLVIMLISPFLLLFCLTLGVQASALTEYQEEIPGHEGQCMGADRKFYKLGEVMTGEQKSCMKKICRGTAAPGSVYVEVQTCSKVSEQPGCKLKSDEKKSYPDCCQRLECSHH